MDPTVNAPTSASEADAWTELSAELHGIADDLAKLAGQPRPSYVALSLHTSQADEPEAVQAVDAVALTLLGRAAETRGMSDGTYHRTASGSRGRIFLSVLQRVPGPRDAELARLRARIAELEASQ